MSKQASVPPEISDVQLIQGDVGPLLDPRDLMLMPALRHLQACTKHRAGENGTAHLATKLKIKLQRSQT